MKNKSSKIIIVCGATASGKSARAIALAQELGGVIINCDAMQVYREMSIITARPTKEQETQAEHQLYGVISAAEKFSVAKWLKLAKNLIDSTDKLPIITGGTGLYIKALMEGLSPIPDIPSEVRAKAEELWQEKKENALKDLDLTMYERLNSGDMQRHIRAIEVIIATGKSLSFWQNAPRIKPYTNTEFVIESVEVERAELYKRCDARFIEMIKQGALAEAKIINDMNLSDDMPAKRSVGLRELLDHIAGNISLEEAIIKGQQATRNYAKRQMTWFRNQIKGR